jgi:hypothetical protein
MHEYGATVAPPALSRANRRAARWPVAVAAALVAALLVGVVAILNPFGSDGIQFADEPTTVSTTTPSVPPTTAVQPPPSTTVPPTTVPGPQAAFGWERVSDPILEDGTNANAVIRHDGGLLAVGISSGYQDGALWRSTDGRTWKRTMDPVLADAELTDVVPYRNGLVVIGNTPFDWENPDREPVIALSEDGESWERIDTSDPEIFVPASFDFQGPLRSIAVAGDRIVVAGTHIWISDDARTWTLAEELEEQAIAHGVVVGDHGIVVVGQTFAGTPSALVWHSTDGDQWTEQRVSTPGRLVTTMYTVAATSAGYVAGGLVGDDSGWTPDGGRQTADAGVWVSPDGLTWTSAVDDREQLGGEYGQWIQGFAEDGAVLVAIGIEMYSNSDSATAVVWESDDAGFTWQRVADPDHRFGNVFEGWAEMRDVVFHDGELVAIGNIVENKYLPAAIGVWLGTRSD